MQQEIDFLKEQVEKKYGFPIGIPEGVSEEAALRALRMMAEAEEKDPQVAEQQSLEAGEILKFLEGRQTEEEEDRTIKALQKEFAGKETVLWHLRLSAPVNEDVQRILLGLAGEKAYLMRQSNGELILLSEVKKALSSEELLEAASEIIDTLAADAMMKAMISVDKSVNNVAELRKSNKNCRSAMVIGTRLNPGENIYLYSRMGTGKILYRLRTEEREEFLNDTLGSFRFANLDREMQTTIRTFFDADLSVTETARRLYIHRNTLIYRIDKLYRLCGLDLRRFGDAVTAQLALQAELLGS